MERKHRRTLELIFARPVPANIRWADIEALFRELDAEIEEREGSRVEVFLFGSVRVFHRPHPSPDTDEGCGCGNAQMAGRKRSETMNTMTISGYQVVIAFDPEIQMFRGEFVGLNGGADFYAADVEGLKHEGEISLRVFLEACERRDIEPRKHYSGKFSLRVDPATHEAAAIAAAAHGQSLNQWARETIRQAALAG